MPVESSAAAAFQYQKGAIKTADGETPAAMPRPNFNTKKVRLKRPEWWRRTTTTSHFNTKKVRLKLSVLVATEMLSCTNFNTKKVRLKPPQVPCAPDPDSRFQYQKGAIKTVPSASFPPAPVHAFQYQKGAIKTGGWDRFRACA